MNFSLNDTFDNFSLSDIQNDLLKSNSTSSLASPRYSTNESETNISKNITSSTLTSSNKQEISFDDSLFLNNSDLSLISDLATAQDNGQTYDSEEPNDTKTSIETAIENFQLIDESFKESPNSSNPEVISNLEEANKTNSNCLEATAVDHVLKLSNWGLPGPVLEKYKARNVTLMFPWQVECLNKPQVLDNHRNLVYSAPTSAGKTLVAEILTIKTVLEREKKVLFILPFVSVVREKMFYFQEILGGSGVRVEGFMGSYNPPGGFQSVQVAICTIEKANSLVNKLLQEGTLSEVGAVVMDEMHLLGDPHRGYLLELLLTKLRYISVRDNDVKIQIIGMSATLPNLELLAKWLDAELYVTTFRPIPLYEQAHVCGEIYDSNLKLIRRLEPLEELDRDTDNILQLCLETLRDSCSVLIFCPTKNWCENLSEQIATAFRKLGSGQSDSSKLLRQQLKPELITELLQQLKYCPVGLDSVLRKTVSFGVAFHHAGLTMDERDIIEAAFRNGVIRVLVATSTLSSGVNLPAKRVIIRTPTFHGKPLDALTYRQMIGRAGRMGRDTSGESLLVCQKNDYKIAKALMTARLQPIESCLEGDGKLKRAILEIIASGVASSPADVQLFTSCTLLAQNEAFESPIKEAIEFLVNHEFIRLQNEENDCKYVATSLAKACLSSSIPPEDGLSLFTELEKARQCFVLETELHLIYLVTPYSACNQWGNIDWMFYMNLWERLPVSMKRVGELVGVRESYIINATRGKISTNTSKLYHKLLVHKRFFVALALQDLVNEIPLGEVANKFSCNRGMMQSLQLTAATFAGMVTAFSKQLGWTSVEILISQFQNRLQFGVSRDLLDLMRLPIVNGKSARALFDAGLESLVLLANSDVNTVENVLHKVIPFETGKVKEGETEFDLKERNKFKNIWITGKEGLTEREAAELLVNNARNYLVMEMGLKEAKWDKSTNANNLEPPSSDSLLSSDKSIFSPVRDSNTPDIPETKPTSDLSMFEDSITIDESKILNCDTSIKDEFMSKYCLSNNTSTSLNSSGDVITTSQDEESMLLLSSRKRSRRDKTTDKFLLHVSSPKKKKRTSKRLVAMQEKEQVTPNNADLTKFEIVNVCNEQLFEMFTNEIKKRQVVSLSLGCGSFVEPFLIGMNPGRDHVIVENKFVYQNRKMEGFALSWGDGAVYYLSLENFEKSLDLIRNLVSNKELTVRMFDCKEQIKVLKRCCDIDFLAGVEDPKVGDWLLQPEGKEKNLQAMTVAYYPQAVDVSQLCGTTQDVGSAGLDVKTSVSPKIRSCTEALITWHLVDIIKQHLHNQDSNLLQVFSTEMKCLRILADMELDGVGISRTQFKNLNEILSEQLSTIAKKAFNLAGRRFTMSSSGDVAKVLGLFKGKKVSINKQVLEKSSHPIGSLVLEWRKINGIMSKMVFPLVKCIKKNRIHGNCIVHTATGRITMHEPNLQNVAKNFFISNSVSGKSVDISCRNAFVAEKGHVLLSADYCQLELRLLAHLSQDEVLCEILRKKGDIFKSIASKWNNVSEDCVTDDLRNVAKQVCYGIIYGMGNKALAEQLNVTEKEAKKLMDTLHHHYPGLKRYIKKVIDNCRKQGFVETISGRRRYLPCINDEKSAPKSQAERQAVNTTIQGSAADIVKQTMIDLEEQFSLLENKPKLVLHLHDELIYEVASKHLREAASLLKRTMEGSVKLSLPFPVKVKWGLSWGDLTELTL